MNKLNSFHDLEKCSTISIVVPALNEEGNIKPLYEALHSYLERIKNVEWEIVFVNDGSTDGTLQDMLEINAQASNVKVINLTRNFGHEIAMTAGLDYAEGDAIVFMDADGQHPPGLLQEMIERWRNGSPVVFTVRKTVIGDNRLTSITRKLFYGIVNTLSDTKLPEGLSDYRLIDREYAEILKQLEEQNRIFRGMLHWIGTPEAEFVSFDAPQRIRGKTKYSLLRKIYLATDAIVQFSIIPLRLASALGLLGLILSLVLAIITLLSAFSPNYVRTGYVTIILAIVFLGSLQLLLLGLIGEYIGRIHVEVKRRPLYVGRCFSKNHNSKLVGR